MGSPQVAKRLLIPSTAFPKFIHLCLGTIGKKT